MSAPRVSLDRARLDRLRQGAVVVRTEPAAFNVTGMGALQCLQGLLTNDLVKPGDHSLVYGALLTPKGMIVVDFWVLRRPQGFLLLAERDGREAALDLFQERGFAEATMREIARKAGVATGAAYYYFPRRNRSSWRSTGGRSSRPTNGRRSRSPRSGISRAASGRSST